jgi:glutathione synthase/RimK-type ligase-like ATP-grasp enzyme
MSFVALATCRNIPEVDVDEPLLLAALAKAGVPARMLAWDDDGVDWEGAALTVIRSTWNYHRRPGPFLAWALRRGDRLLNAPSVVRWNHHKRYLRDLEASGVPVVPTLWIDRASPPSAPIAELVAERAWTDIVAKPAVSAGSFNTHRLRGPPFDAAVLAELVASGDAMLQPYVASVDTYGERSLVYIDGEITHAIRKSPRFAGGEEVVSEATSIADDERALAEQALLLVNERPVYARIDIVRDAQGAVMLSELELIEPSLFLRQCPAALERLASAIARRFRAPFPATG